MQKPLERRRALTLRTRKPGVDLAVQAKHVITSYSIHYTKLYEGSTLRAAEMFDACYPDEPMTVLVDYFGREITDSLTVCRRFPRRAAAGTRITSYNVCYTKLLRNVRPSAHFFAKVSRCRWRY